MMDHGAATVSLQMGGYVRIIFFFNTVYTGVVSGKPPKFCGLGIQLMTTLAPLSWYPDRVLSLH